MGVRKSVWFPFNAYYALFYSHLSYAASIWGITSPQNLDKIIKLQKKCVRILSFADFDSHAHPLFIDLKIIKIAEVIKLQQLRLVYESYHNLVPDDLRTLFQRSYDSHSTTHPLLRSDHNGCLTVPSIKTVHHGIKLLRY